MAGKRGAPVGNQNAKGRRAAKIVGTGGVVGGLAGAGLVGTHAAMSKAAYIGVAKAASVYIGSSGGLSGSLLGYATVDALSKGAVAKAAIGGAKVGGLHGAAIGAGAAAAGVGTYYAYKKYKARKKR